MQNVFYNTQASTKSAAVVRPLFVINTRADISDLSWSYLRPYEVAVSFAHRPFLRIYNLHSNVMADSGEEYDFQV